MKYKPNQLFIRYKIDPLCSNSNIGSVIKILNDKSFIYLKHVSIRNNDSEYSMSLTHLISGVRMQDFRPYNRLLKPKGR